MCQTVLCGEHDMIKLLKHACPKVLSCMISTVSVMVRHALPHQLSYGHALLLVYNTSLHTKGRTQALHAPPSAPRHVLLWGAALKLPRPPGVPRAAGTRAAPGAVVGRGRGNASRRLLLRAGLAREAVRARQPLQAAEEVRRGLPCRAHAVSAPTMKSYHMLKDHAALSGNSADSKPAMAFQVLPQAPLVGVTATAWANDAITAQTCAQPHLPLHTVTLGNMRCCCSHRQTLVITISWANTHLG